MRIRIQWRQHGELESCPDSGVKRLSKRAYLGCYHILKPHLKKQFVIPPEANAAFVAAMEDVLEVYHRFCQHSRH
jgi:hypothetical protein